MATTQEFYKTQGRNPRYATVLSTFANGMYITNEQIPEGYAKYLINYDIDDTGTYIKPRKGRSVFQEIPIWGSDAKLSASTKRPRGADIICPVWVNDMTDSVENPITLGTIDLIWGLGTPAQYRDFVELSAGHNRSDYDERYYYFFDYLYNNDTNTAEEYTPGWDYDKQVTYSYKTGWMTIFREDKNQFESVQVVGMSGGKTPARVIKDAWVFDKQIKELIFRPVWCNYNNSVVMFSSSEPQLYRRPNRTPMYNLESAYLKPYLNSFTAAYSSFTSDYDGQFYDHYFIRPKAFDTEVSCATATTNGYNMLHYAPYKFDDQPGSRNIPLGIMCYVKGDTGKYDVPVMQPIMNQVNRFRFVIQYATQAVDLDYDVDYLDLNAYSPDDTNHWVNLTTVGYSRYMNEIYYDWMPTTDKFILRVTVYTGTKTSSTGKASAYPFSRAFSAISGDSNSSKLEVYNLNTAKGMVSWLDCIGLYGVEGAIDGIFFSDVGNPGYFPFPNNVITFDGTVYAVKNYMNNLLVITDSSFWLLQPGVSIAATVCTKVLDNLDMTEIDATNVVVLKDSIFFKSGNAFYVLKPNKYTSDNTDLKKYVNSTAISNMLNNFTESVLELLRMNYRTEVQWLRKEWRSKDLDFVDFDVIDNVSYLIDEEVHYIYNLLPYLEGENFPREDIAGQVELHLIYNTLTRAWRTYLVAIGAREVVGYNPVLYQDRKSRDTYEFFITNGEARHKFVGSGYPGDMTCRGYLTITKKDNKVQQDNISCKVEQFTTDTHFTGTWDDSYVQEFQYSLAPYYENYNYIDTGNVALTDISLKRFRELQISIYSKEHEQIEFYGDFRVDGAEHVSATKYEIEAITDKRDPEYGHIFITPTEVPNLFKWEDSTLHSEYGLDRPPKDTDDETRYLWEHSKDELGRLWQLDLSAFPDLDTINMKVELRGKGRRCSFQLLNTSLQQYQLSNWMWVYRLMNARRM